MAAQSQSVPYIEGMDFTVGVDTPSGAAKNAAATGVPNTVSGAGGSIITFSMNEISSVEDLMTSLDVSASVGGGCGLFSASARMDYAKSCSVHTSSVFLVVSVNVTEAFNSILHPGISQEAADLLANGKLDRFQAEFGDMFVRGIRSGGQFFGVIEVFTKDETDKQSVSVSLSASYAAFSASGKFSQSFSDTVSSRQTKVTCHIEGGQDLELPTQVDTMTARATNFPHEVAGHAVPYTALLDPYDVLPLPEGPNFVDLQQQKDVLAQCAVLRNERWQWLNDIDYISRNPDQFTGVDAGKLASWQNDLSADINTIAAAASAALNNPKSAQIPTTLKIATLTLPPRIAGSPVTVTVTVPTLIGISAYSLGGPDRDGNDPYAQQEADMQHFKITWVRGDIRTDRSGVDNVIYDQQPPGGSHAPQGSELTVTTYWEGA